MQYLSAFGFPSDLEEDGYLLSFPYQLEMQCYDHNNVYPFRVFSGRGLGTLHFAPMTMLYGGNGSGKTTCLNLIAEKLQLHREAPYTRTPYTGAYLDLCKVQWTYGNRVPEGSRMIASDDVFDFLLNVRAVNDGVAQRRAELFAEYDEARTTPCQLHSLSEYEEFKRRVEAKSRTKSKYVSRRLPRELVGKSNGESAYAYFTEQIRENALYILDEPENSLSASWQIRLAQYIEEAVRFYGCQCILSTHSPFFLSMRGAVIYNLDETPICQRPWTTLENVRIWHEFFEEHRAEFSG